MELTIFIICFVVAITIISIFLGFIIFNKSRNFQNKYKPHKRVCQKMSLVEYNKTSTDNNVDIEIARENTVCQITPIKCLEIESLESIKKEEPSNEPVDISLLESLDILHLGNLDAAKHYRSYSDECLHISSYLMNFEFLNDVHHHLSSTRRNPLHTPYVRGKQKLMKSNTLGNSYLDFQSSFVKEFEADIQTRLCSTRRSSTSLTIPDE
uniref:TMEM132D_N domain-containing protein n=1 Tax=Strongyloides stercoralis TaxID=6248 RepID=A0A0K0EID2_STRER